MSWTTLTYEITNSAEDVNSNFQNIRSGNMQPLSGTSMGLADNTYDIGSSTYRFSDIHIQNLDIASGGTIENTWELIAETTLSDTATSIEFTGLNGDTDEIYHIVSYIKSEATGTCQMFINGDSAANYGYQRLRGVNNVVSSDRGTGSNKIFFINVLGYDTTTALFGFSDFYLYAKTGYERLAIKTAQENAGNTYIQDASTWGFIWNNKTSTITSLKIEMITTSFATGTSIELWTKR